MPEIISYLSSLTLEMWQPLLLAPLPFLVFYLIPAAKENSAALRVPFLQALTTIETENTSLKKRSLLSFILLFLIWLLILIASCRPVFIGDAIRVPAQARDLLLAVDISGSMDEQDMQLNSRLVKRIDIVKHVLAEFIQRRKGDRIGLILFADNAYIQAPLTYDTKTVSQLMLEAQLGFAGQKTAIGDAIGLSIKRLSERPNDSRTLILLTDGANNAGNVEPADAANMATQNDVKIYTIGVGAETVMRRTLFGSNIAHNPSRDLDEKTLKQIAKQTGGQFFRATNSAELANIYHVLDELEPVDQEKQFFRPIKHVFYWPLGLAIVLSALAVSIPLFKNVRSSFKNNTHYQEQL